MKRVIVVVALLIGVPAQVAGQVEVGLNAGFNFTRGEDRSDQTQFAIPYRDLVVGIPIGDRLVLESLFVFEWDSEEGDKKTLIGLLPGITFLFSEPGASRFYVRGEAGIEHVSASWIEDGSVTRTLIGAAAGVRVPIGEVGFLRFESNYIQWLETDIYYGYSVLGLLVGFSVMLR